MGRPSGGTFAEHIRLLVSEMLRWEDPEVGRMEGPRLRWKAGQRLPRPVIVPRFALRDLAAATQFQ